MGWLINPQCDLCAASNQLKVSQDPFPINLVPKGGTWMLEEVPQAH